MTRACRPAAMAGRVLVAAGALLAGAAASPGAAGGAGGGVDTSRSDPARDSLALSYTVVPYAFFAPETHWGGGAAGGAFKRLHPGARPSSLLAQGQYTQKRQYQGGIHLDHHAPGNRASGWADLSFREFPDRFFGLGSNASDTLEEAFTARTFQAAAQGMKALGGGFKAGFIGVARRQAMVKTEAGGALARGGIPGAGDWTVAGLGPQIAWDTRDNVFFPRSGSFLELGNAFYTPWDGEGSAFQQVKLDARHYQGLGDRQVLAFHALLDMHRGRVPFAMQPGLGGGSVLRGYYQGRHRDKSLGALQLEYRFPIWRRLGGAAFAAGGMVAPDPSAFPDASLLPAAGVGLRYRLNAQGVNLRVDMAFDRDKESSLYVTFMEAF